MVAKNITDMVACEVIITNLGKEKYTVDIPAINKSFNVKKPDEIVEKAREIIGKYSMTHTIPTNFKIPKAKLRNSQRVILITLNLFDFRKGHQFLSVKKNCTIPYKLAELGKEQGVNFSKTLTNALKQELKVSDVDGENSEFHYAVQRNEITDFPSHQMDIKFEISSSQSEKGLLDLINGLTINRYARVAIVNDSGEVITYLNLDGLKIKCSDNLMGFGKVNHSSKFLQQVLKTINMKFNAREFNNNQEFMLHNSGLEDVDKYVVTMEFYK